MPGRKTRSFGTIRQLSSGRCQARYRGPDGLLRSAPSTFVRKGDAARWLALTEAELLGGGWIDPDAGRVPFTGYAAAWISERAGLRPKTIQLYRYLLRRHLAPAFAAQTVVGITEADVRRWRADLLTSGVSPVTAAKAYRLLKAVLATAADDGLIRRNPCRIKGADALAFTGPGGKPLRHSNFRRGTWLPAQAATGLPGIHFHDLRHAGNHLVANAGANLRELTERMGHSSSRAALIYQHSTTDRQRTLANAVADRTRFELGAEHVRGTGVARADREAE